MSVFQRMIEKEPAKYPARMGKKWDDDEVLKLLKSIQKRKSVSEIAKEHQRTEGAINSERRKLAADYWFNDKRSIEEIIKFTGLSRETIEDAIKRRSTAKEIKNKYIISDEQPETSYYTKGASDLENKCHITNDIPETPLNIKDVITILKDIQHKLSVLMEKVQ